MAHGYQSETPHLCSWPSQSRLRCVGCRVRFFHDARGACRRSGGQGKFTLGRYLGSCCVPVLKWNFQRSSAAAAAPPAFSSGRLPGHNFLPIQTSLHFLAWQHHNLDGTNVEDLDFLWIRCRWSCGWGRKLLAYLCRYKWCALFRRKFAGQAINMAILKKWSNWWSGWLEELHLCRQHE